MRYTFHGGGPCDGALNGAVMPGPLSSGSAGQPLSAHASAMRASASGSVTRAASPSTTTSAPRTDTATEHRGSRATLRPFLAEDVRPKPPAGQVRDQVPPVHRRAARIGAKRKAALIGDVALVGGGRRHGPGRHRAVLLSCTHGAGEVEEVARPGLRELHQRAVRVHPLVPACDRPEQHFANLGGNQRHAEISHQALVSNRQPRHSPFLPAATGRRPSRSGPGVPAHPYHTRPTRHERTFGRDRRWTLSWDITWRR